MNIAIIVAAGKGKRMQKRENKLFLLLNKEPIINKTLKIFQNSKSINKIILVTNKDDKKRFEKLKNQYKKISNIIEGGKERQDSSYNGIKAASKIKKITNEDIILIHNAANPFIDEALINDTIKAAKKYGAATVGFSTKDTIKYVEEGIVKQTLPRINLWQTQTPQAMKLFLAKKAFQIAERESFQGTDDVSLVEKIGGQVKMVYCDRKNIKITDQHDLAYLNKLTTASRIGVGQDSHRFVEETEVKSKENKKTEKKSISKSKPLIIGGVKIQDKQGFEANSDGDVLLHSLFNAISTSIGMKSLGFYADDMCKKGITDSKTYLEFILEKMQAKNYKINNVAAILEGKKPKLDPHIDKIKTKLSKILKIKPENIGIAATSGEELSSFGKGEGMQCFTMVSISNT